MTAKKPIKSESDEEVQEEPRRYASPPCYLHELDPQYQGVPDEENKPPDED